MSGWRSEAADLEQLRAALQSTANSWPDLHLLAGAGPKLQVRLLALPVGTLLREMPALVLFKPWQTPDGNYVLVVGRAGRYRRDRGAASGVERPRGAAAGLAAVLGASGDRGDRRAAGDIVAATRRRRRAACPRCRSGCRSRRRLATSR